MQASPNQGAAPAVLEALAALAHAVRFEDLPKNAIAAAKARVLDTLGCAFGALHSGFASDIVRINKRMSGGTAGLPRRRRLFHVQNRRKPRRCQARTVSGLTMRSDDRQSFPTRESQTHRKRSAVFS